jgi:hypothetical protein
MKPIMIKSDPVEEICPACNGTGLLTVIKQPAPGKRIYGPRCTKCGGKGKLPAPANRAIRKCLCCGLVLFAPRATILIASSGKGRCNAFLVLRRSQRSSSVIRMTGMPSGESARRPTSSEGRRHLCGVGTGLEFRTIIEWPLRTRAMSVLVNKKPRATPGLKSLLR